MSTPIDINALGAAIRARRGSRGLRSVAQEIGVSAPTLSRIEQGKVPDLDTYMRLCRWLGVEADRFRDEDPEAGECDTHLLEKTSPQEVITAHLRADKLLNPETSEALIRMIHLAYDAARKGEIGKET